MTLEEAIKHEEEIVKEEQYEYQECVATHNTEGAMNCRKYAEEHRQLAEWLKELKQLKEQTKWIPVSERLPKESIAVLVWCPERKNIYCACYEEKQWWIFGAYFQKITLEVIAWMPLPQPYEPKGVIE